MTDLARLYAEIAFLRRGPQDVPASMLLLALTVVAYFAVNILVNVMLPPLPDPWFPMLLIDVLFTLAWYSTLLRLLHRQERVLQTTTAVFGYRAVLAPLSIGSEWLVRRFATEQSSWQLPLTVGYAAVAVWMIAANSRVLKAALEWSMFQCVALVLLEFIASGLLAVAIVPFPR
ncbi:MAG TPA: hypothetical protein VMD03_08380 [Steroidobacteraceae bacterium]|nr:hypothetical protein [Steroidobacteraceae bacterium]